MALKYNFFLSGNHTTSRVNVLDKNALEYLMWEIDVGYPYRNLGRVAHIPERLAKTLLTHISRQNIYMKIKQGELQELACIAFNELIVALDAGYPKLTSQNHDFSKLHVPLFVTLKKSDTLRGCIGTFNPQKIPKGVKLYTLAAAFKDPRFGPLRASEISQLSISITLLGPLKQIKDPYNWEIGKHGVEAEFPGGLSATFLPEVAEEQGWTKDETFEMLARKAGAESISGMELSVYEGLKYSIDYAEYVKFVSKNQ